MAAYIYLTARVRKKHYLHRRFSMNRADKSPKVQEADTDDRQILIDPGYTEVPQNLMYLQLQKVNLPPMDF